MPTRYLYVLFLTVLFLPTLGQMITPTQQKALNNYVDYANQSSDEMSSIARSLIEYYPRLLQLQKGKTVYGARYACPVQLETYYFEKALTDSHALGGPSSELNSNLKSLQHAAGQIDNACKDLDVYHKLEDYKKDQYARALQIINDIVPLFKVYQQKQTELTQALEKATAGFGLDSKVSAYAKAAQLMQSAMQNEKDYLDTWDINLNSSMPTGWDVGKLKESIVKTEGIQEKFKSTTLTIKYPASSQYNAFVENVASILQVKKSGWDGYNAESKKSDEHTNQVYSSLINYYNGTLVSFYNSFLKYASNDGYYGLAAIKYTPMFSIRNEAVVEKVVVEPFADLPFPALVPAKSAAPIPKPQAAVLNKYVDFINECLRQSRMMQQGIYNLETRASYLKGVTSFQGKGAITYTYDNFELPQSLFQELELSGRQLPPKVSETLLTQARVLMNILQEMEQLSGWIAQETSTKRYESDHLNALSGRIVRYIELFEIIDTKKELLYHDIRTVYDSHAIANPDQNWMKSWIDLRQLVDDDHGALLQAKLYYRGVSTTKPDTRSIDEQLRAVLVKEYDNLKGIEKLGRYNGLCPYTPYEDIPETSRRLSEKMNQLPAPQKNSNRHPYNDHVYLYNEIVDDFNKFCDLSKLDLLKTIKQPELYFSRDSSPQNPDPQPQVTNQSASHSTAPDVAVSTPVVGGGSTHAATQVVVHDTVYIERRDTVYLAEEELQKRSMEGYAVNNLVLLLDVSGSMNAPGKLPLLKESVLSVLDMMRPEDQLSIIIYSGKAKVLLPPTSFGEAGKIRQVIEGLSSSGKTDGNAGISIAYKTADKNYIRGGNNRIILATDGEFAISQESYDLASRYAREDIFLSVFNFGKGVGSIQNLEKLCGASKGNYTLITNQTMDAQLMRELKARKAK